MDTLENRDQLLLVIRQIAEKAGLEHTIKWGSDMYTHQGKNIMGAVALKHYVALWFPKGVFLEDPYKVLTTSKGKGAKALRQWRLHAITELEEDKLIEYIKAAIDIEKRGLKVPVDRSGPPPPPPLLAQALEGDPRLKSAFDQLTPGRQKEYIAYIIEPKREATRQRRLEKILPMILNGEGLHDTYRSS